MTACFARILLSLVTFVSFAYASDSAEYPHNMKVNLHRLRREPDFQDRRGDPAYLNLVLSIHDKTQKYEAQVKNDYRKHISTSASPKHLSHLRDSLQLEKDKLRDSEGKLRRKENRIKARCREDNRATNDLEKVQLRLHDHMYAVACRQRSDIYAKSQVVDELADPSHQNPIKQKHKAKHSS